MVKGQNYNLAPGDNGHKHKPKFQHSPSSKVNYRASGKKASQKLIFSPRPDWHAAEFENISIPPVLTSISHQLLERVHNYAATLLEAESASYTSTHAQSSESYKFMSTIMSSGTWSDKVSALTLVVQESPLHTVKPLENLISLAGKRSRQQALMALEALKDMLSQGNLLPSHRKLRMFVKQPELIASLQHADVSWTSDKSLPGSLTKAHLVYWAYEDFLKRQYFDLLKIIESWCSDEVEYSRLRAVTFVWELLKEKPEQEENLLRLLINKLGDTSKKVASRASHLLLQLQASHPMMKPIIVDNIETDILLRSGQSDHAKYYAVITLNQTVLQIGKVEVPNKLLDVYFGLFIAILNRSRADTDLQNDSQGQNSVNQGKKRKRPLQNSKPSNERPEQELQDKIIAQILTGINRAFPFSQKDSDTFEKHLDTMFKITHSANFNTSIQALLLIQQISSTHNVNTDRYLRTLYESLLDPRLIKSSKHTMYLNLLYRSLKTDASIKRVKAFVKRILQIMQLHEPAFACALLYLVIELRRIFPGVQAMLDQPEAWDEDEEEVFVDAPEDPSTTPNVSPIRESPNADHTIPSRSPSYDPRKRDPEHSNADNTCLWELAPWLSHYHPSVTVFARNLLPAMSNQASTQPPLPKPDPAAHTLIHFLDRFVYRNPKTKPDSTLRGTSLMQPALASTNATDSLLISGGKQSNQSSASLQTTQPLNSEAFWSKKIENVAPDEVFFHQYFAEVGPRRKAARGVMEGREDQKTKSVDNAVDAEEEEFSEADEDEIWRALARSSGADGVVDGEDDASLDDENIDDAIFDYEDEDEDEGNEGGVDLELDDDADDDPFNLDEGSSAVFSSEGEVDDDDDDDDNKEAGEAQEDNSAKARRKKLKSLPTFASIEDYAHLINDDAGDAEDSSIS